MVPAFAFTKSVLLCHRVRAVPVMLPENNVRVVVALSVPAVRHKLLVKGNTRHGLHADLCIHSRKLACIAVQLVAALGDGLNKQLGAGSSGCAFCVLEHSEDIALFLARGGNGCASQSVLGYDQLRALLGQLLHALRIHISAVIVAGLGRVQRIRKALLILSFLQVQISNASLC